MFTAFTTYLYLSNVRLEGDLPDEVLVSVVPQPDQELWAETAEGAGGEDVEGTELTVLGNAVVIGKWMLDINTHVVISY